MVELFPQSARRFYRLAKMFETLIQKAPKDENGHTFALAPMGYPLALILLTDAKSLYKGLYGEVNDDDQFLSCEHCKDLSHSTCWMQRVVKPFGFLCFKCLKMGDLAKYTEMDFLASATEYVDTLLFLRTTMALWTRFYYNLVQHVQDPVGDSYEIEQLLKFCNKAGKKLPCQNIFDFACQPDNLRYMAEYAYSLFCDDADFRAVRDDADPFAVQETEAAIREILDNGLYEEAFAEYGNIKDKILAACVQ